MSSRFDLDHPQMSGNEIQMERLRARIARRPGRWRRRMRRTRERRDQNDPWNQPGWTQDQAA